MKLESLRQQVAAYGRRLGRSGLGVGTTGNVSAYDRATALMAISPSSMDYDAVAAGDVVLMNLAGDLVDSARRPSTEWGMPLACYQQREDIDALVHTHSPAATTLAVLGRELPAVHYMIALAGAARIPLAPYHLYGSPELAAAAVEAMHGGRACLLQNHGVLAAGADLEQAWSLAEQIEFCADIYLRAQAAGEPQVLSDQQIQDVIEQLSSYQRQH